MNPTKLLARLDELLAKGDKVLASKHTPSEWPLPIVDAALFYEWQVGALAYLRRVFGPGHTYSEKFAERVNSTDHDDAVEGRSILRAAREDLVGGHLTALDAIVTADLFSDFLEMSDYLLAEGYKDASAVMIGSVLEEHLRKLCSRHGIALDYTNAKGTVAAKKADVMNADLTKAGIYLGTDQKAVTSWLGLRNSAAHGKYGEYTDNQVRLMHQGVLGFITRTPL